MPSPRGIHSFSIHFDGKDADAHVLPAPVLIESITQIQRIVLLLAKMHRGEPIGQHTSFSRILRDEFALFCHLPEAGSYSFPVEVGHQSGGAASPDLIEVCELFHRVTEAVGGEDETALQEIVTDTQYLGLLADAYRKARPSPQSGVFLSIEDHHHRRILDGRRPLPTLDAHAPSPAKTPLTNTVSRLLVGMDFDKRNIRLMPLDGKVITVRYDDDAERPLLDHRRGWITVSGDVLYDRNRKPVAVKHARDFVILDESDIELSELFLYNVLYRADPPLRFRIHYDSEDQLYSLDGDFDISLSAGSRHQLLPELREVLSMLWSDYAQEEPQRLSPKSCELRAELLDRLREA